MQTLFTEIHIEATPAEVWATLMDFDQYGSWNPFITDIDGETSIGGRLDAVLSPEGKKPTTFHPTVVDNRPAERFAWLGHLGLPGIFDGRHIFELSAERTGTRFVQREEFTGILARPVLAFVGSATAAGFEAMNEALKERVEARAGQS